MFNPGWMENGEMTPEKLRSIYGEPSPRAAAKVISSFDKHCRNFIEHSTFLLLATTGNAGLDISPKGDPAGFVEVESNHTLLLPDRPGNNRIDSLMNILENPAVAILFMIAGISETLRVNGTAEITDDSSVCSRFRIKERDPKTVLRVTASEIYMHCGKAPIRGGLWNPGSWPESRPLPSLFEILQDHTAIPSNSTDQAAVDDSYRRSLY